MLRRIFWIFQRHQKMFPRQRYNTVWIANDYYYSTRSHIDSQVKIIVFYLRNTVFRSFCVSNSSAVVLSNKLNKNRVIVPLKTLMQLSSGFDVRVTRAVLWFILHTVFVLYVKFIFICNRALKEFRRHSGVTSLAVYL